MNIYWTLFGLRALALMQYRLAACAGILTQIFWGFIKTIILYAFYSQSTTTQPLSLTEAITFIWIGQALLQLLPWNLDKEVETQVRNGTVAYELVRPIDLYSLWFFRALAMRLAPTLLRCLPLFTLALFFGWIPPPASLGHAIFFIISLIGSALLSAAITSWVMISLFWTLSGQGIERLLPHLTVFLSGMVVPLPLFPSWMQPFLLIQPFRGIIDIPARLYTGIIPLASSYEYLLFQIGWVVFFVIGGRYLLHRAVHAFVIEGG